MDHVIFESAKPLVFVILVFIVKCGISQMVKRMLYRSVPGTTHGLFSAVQAGYKLSAN